MPLSSPYQIVLSGDEQAVLAARARSVRGPFRDRLRARIVLALAAARLLTDLLERGDREGLPVLEWTISHHGAQVTGRSYAQPSAARRAALVAWAAALGIKLGEEYHQDSRMTTITGTAKRERTRHGFAAITFTGDIWEDCPARPRGPGMLVRELPPAAI